MRGQKKSHKRVNLDTAASMELENTFLLSDVNCGMLNLINSPSLFGVIPTSELTMAFSIAFKLKKHTNNQKFAKYNSTHKIAHPHVQ